VVFLDVPGIVAAAGVVSRWLRHRRSARPEMPAGNTDGWAFAFLWMVARRRERPEIERALRGADNVIRTRTRRGARRAMETMVSNNSPS
jgi:hypothetical protein